jgi:hypothetical protein
MPTSTHACVSTTQAFDRAPLPEGKVVVRTPGAPEYIPEYPYAPKHSRMVAAAHFGGSAAALAAGGVGGEVRFATFGTSDDGSLGDLRRGSFALPLPSQEGSASGSARVAHVSFEGTIDGCEAAATATGALGELVAGRRLGCVAATREGDAYALRSAPRGASSGFAWEQVASWRATEDDETLAAVGGDAALAAGLRTSYGALSVARMGTDGEMLLMADEATHEARLIDVATGKRTRSIWCTHGPTGVVVARFPSVSPNQELVAVAEGPLCSLWDPRTGGPGSNACISRLTLAGAEVLDVATSEALAARNLIAVASDDRSVSIYDVRKWAKVSVESNVLKFATNGIAVIGTAEDKPFVPCAVFATGIDSEARVVDAVSNASTVDANKKRQAIEERGGTVDSMGKGGLGTASNGAKGAASDDAAAEATGPQGVFRQRLASSTHCRAGWHGAPVRVCGGAAAAVSLSTHGELFLARESSGAGLSK